jgi:hypothetical protein
MTLRLGANIVFCLHSESYFFTTQRRESIFSENRWQIRNEEREEGATSLKEIHFVVRTKFAQILPFTLVMKSIPNYFQNGSVSLSPCNVDCNYWNLCSWSAIEFNNQVYAVRIG